MNPDCDTCSGHGYATFETYHRPFALRLQKCDLCDTLPDDDAAAVLFVQQLSERDHWALKLAKEFIAQNPIFGRRT